MQIVGLDHVQLAMPPGGEVEARKFYAGLLGLTEVAKPEPLAARGGCWFEGPSTFIHLGVQDDFVPARKAHPAFLVSDLDALYHILETAGVPVTPDDALPSTRRFYAADPFGNRIEFIQNDDGFSQSWGVEPLT
jgi:catechol 2,3-dioxygenase-like lactoylglutathione lyase family enzyme